MHNSLKQLRLIAVVILSAFIFSVFNTPARAANAVWLAHRAIRLKIMKEASDRYDVQFLTTHTDKLPGGLRVVTGKGKFRRHRKPGQNFTYHTTINIQDNSDKNTGYTLQ